MRSFIFLILAALVGCGDVEVDDSQCWDVQDGEPIFLDKCNRGLSAGDGRI